MQTVSVPWSMWYDTRTLDLTFPDAWDLTVSHMKGGPDIGEAGIRRALEEPIGAPRLRDLARGRRDAAILVDDLTRPTPAYRILPCVLEELAAGGLGDDRVRIVCAVASHRPMIREDMIKKLGVDIVDRLEVVNHNAYDNLEFYGNSSQGIPIWVNRDFARSDVKIAAGMITPRGGMFGGGSKLLIPGACGRQTIFANHSYCPSEIFREHIEEVAGIIGLEYIVNPLLNGEGGVMAMVAGHPEEAFQRGVEIAKDLYASPVPRGMDVIVCNAWPKDTEGTQSGMARVPLHAAGHEALRPGGTMVITAACPEGLGFHSVMGPGTLFKERGRARMAAEGAERQRPREIVFTPNMNKYDVRAQFGPDVIHYRTWPEVLADLERHHGPAAKACVFPYGAIQYGVA